MDDTEKYNIKIVERCFKILDYATEQNRPVSIQDVCEELQINANMAFRLLNSLIKTGYFYKDETTGLFGVSLKTLRLSRNALLSLEIRRVTMPYLELLWNHCPKANINMAVYYQGDVLVIDRLDSVNLPRTYFTPGRTLPFHCTGMGKVLTCMLPEKEIDELIKEKGLKQYTEKTIISAAGVKDELKKVAAERVGRDRNEFIQGDNCSAIPLYDKNGSTIAAISVSALETYMSAQEVEDLIPKIRETAHKISYMLGYSDGL